jgi:hypothetical protein
LAVRAKGPCGFIAGRAWRAANHGFCSRKNRLPAGLATFR